jgi:hypothetical protein
MCSRGRSIAGDDARFPQTEVTRLETGAAAWTCSELRRLGEARVMVRRPHQNATATPPRKYDACDDAADGTNRRSASFHRRRKHRSRKPVPPPPQQSHARRSVQLTVWLGHARPTAAGNRAQTPGSVLRPQGDTPSMSCSPRSRRTRTKDRETQPRAALAARSTHHKALNLPQFSSRDVSGQKAQVGGKAPAIHPRPAERTNCVCLRALPYLGGTPIVSPRVAQDNSAPTG